MSFNVGTAINNLIVNLEKEITSETVNAETLNANNASINNLEVLGTIITPNPVESAVLKTNSIVTIDNAILNKTSYVKDIVGIGNITNSYEGIVDSIYRFQLRNEDNDPTGIYRNICLEWNNNKTSIRGVAYDDNGQITSFSPYFNITNSAFNSYYGKADLNSQDPYFIVDYDGSINETRILFYYCNNGEDSFDSTPYPQVGNPSIFNLTTNYYVKTPTKKLLSNPYLNELYVYNLDSSNISVDNISVDNLTASNYTNLPISSLMIPGIVQLNNSTDATTSAQASTPQALVTVKNSLQNQINSKLNLTGGVLTGSITGTNCNMLLSESQNFRLQDFTKVNKNCGIQSEGLGNMLLYANDNVNSEMNFQISNSNKMNLSQVGLQLINNTNCTLTLEAGLGGYQNRILFGDAAIANKGRIHYDLPSNTLDFHTNSNSTPNLRMGSSGMTYNNDSHSFNSLNGSTNYLNIISNGNIGINTTSASELLTLRNGSNNTSLGLGNSRSKMISSNNALYFSYITDFNNPSSGIECSQTGTNPSLGIGVIRDSNRAHMTFDFLQNIRFFTANTQRMIILPSGNVGIGTNTPDSNLTIGPSGVNANGNLQGVGMLSTSGVNRHYAVGQSNLNNVFLKWTHNNNAALGYGSISTYAGSNQLILQEGGGNVGICKQANTYALELLGNASKTIGGTTWIDASDIRIKENIEDANLDILYDNIKNIKLHYYRKIDKYSPNETDRHQIGVIAQELKEGGVYPKAVQITPLEKFKVGTELVDYEEKDEEGNIIIKQKEQDVFEEMENFHTVNYDQLYKANLGATQKLIQKVEEQSRKIDIQDQRINSLYTLLIDVMGRLSVLENKN